VGAIGAAALGYSLNRPTEWTEICKYSDKMAADDVVDVVLSAAVKPRYFSKFSELKTPKVMKTRKNCEPLLDDAINGRGATGFIL